jgi:hypothetical protein
VVERQHDRLGDEVLVHHDQHPCGDVQGHRVRLAAPSTRAHA